MAIAAPVRDSLEAPAVPASGTYPRSAPPDGATRARVTPPRPDRPPGPVPRLAYLDTLKVALTALVIAHHAGQAYGPTGGRWPIFEPERAPVLGPFFAVNAAFFMGLFFFISALFLPGSFDRKGAGDYARDRIVRLGLPLACFTLVFFAPLSYADYAARGGALGFLPYLAQVYLGQWRVDFGHLWFLAHLLVYSAVYAGWRLLTARPARGRPESRIGPEALQSRPPGHPTILGFTLALAAVTFVVRLAYPIDRWVNLFGLLPSEVGHLPQYVALFAAGIVATRRRWLHTLPAATGKTWLAVGVVATALRFAYLPASHLLGPDALPRLAGGGLSAGAALWSIWEAFICVGLCLGLVALFRERFDAPGRWLRTAAPNAFGAYVIHILPVVGLQLALAGVALPPLAKFALVTAVAVPLCFALAAGLRRLPGVRSVL
jgi:glucans biosynthesis protein C